MDEAKENVTKKNKILLWAAHTGLIAIISAVVFVFVNEVILDKSWSPSYLLISFFLLAVIIFYTFVEREQLMLSMKAILISAACFLVSALLFMLSDFYVNLPVWLIGGILVAAFFDRGLGMMYVYFYVFQAIYLQGYSVQGLVLHFVTATAICFVIPKMKTLLSMLYVMVFAGSMVTILAVLLNKMLVGREFFLSILSVTACYFGCILLTMLFRLFFGKWGIEKEEEEEPERTLNKSYAYLEQLAEDTAGGLEEAVVDKKLLGEMLTGTGQLSGREKTEPGQSAEGNRLWINAVQESENIQAGEAGRQQAEHKPVGGISRASKSKEQPGQKLAGGISWANQSEEQPDSEDRQKEAVQEPEDIPAGGQQSEYKPAGGRGWAGQSKEQPDSEDRQKEAVQQPEDEQAGGQRPENKPAGVRGRAGQSKEQPDSEDGQKEAVQEPEDEQAGRQRPENEPAGEADEQQPENEPAGEAGGQRLENEPAGEAGGQRLENEPAGEISRLEQVEEQQPENGQSGIESPSEQAEEEQEKKSEEKKEKEQEEQPEEEQPEEEQPEEERPEEEQPEEEQPDYSVYCAENAKLLQKLKAFKRPVFAHSLLVGRMAGGAAEKIGANVSLAQAAGYYHDIGKLYSGDAGAETLRIAQEEQFPEGLRAVLQEYAQKETPIVSREGAIVLLTDTVVTMYAYLNSVGKMTTPEKIVDNVVGMRVVQGVLSKSGLSISDCAALRDYYVAQITKQEEKKAAK